MTSRRQEKEAQKKDTHREAETKKKTAEARARRNIAPTRRYLLYGSVERHLCNDSLHAAPSADFAYHNDAHKAFCVGHIVPRRVPTPIFRQGSWYRVT